MFFDGEPLNSEEKKTAFNEKYLPLPRIRQEDMKRVCNIFRGMGVALVTPFCADGSVDMESLSLLVDKHLKEKTDFLCVLGTTAETPCLSIEEKREILKTVVERVKGRIPVLLGCGGNNTREVLHYLQNENLAGVDGVLIVTPYYNKPSQEGLYRHFKTIASATSLPVVLYNVPGRTGVNMEACTTLRIAADCPNVVAIKEASGKISQIEDILNGAPEGFEVLSGDDAITLELLTVGVSGVISVIGNAYPFRFGEMVHMAMNGRFSEALRMHRSFSELYKLMTAEGNPVGIKGLLAELGVCANYLRLPLVPASVFLQERIRGVLEQTAFE